MESIDIEENNNEIIEEKILEKYNYLMKFMKKCSRP